LFWPPPRRNNRPQNPRRWAGWAASTPAAGAAAGCEGAGIAAVVDIGPTSGAGGALISCDTDVVLAVAIVYGGAACVCHGQYSAGSVPRAKYSV
jgi:hypothetical protein